MQTEERTNPHDDKILAGMITDTTVLARINHVWNGKLFAATTSNMIASWAIDHYRQHHEPPGLSVMEDKVISWAQDHQDKATVDMLDMRMRSIAGRCERLSDNINPDYLIKLAQHHFEKIDVERTADKAQQALKAGHLKQAQEILAAYRRIPLDASVGVDPFCDDDLVREAFEKKTQTLVEYDGALGTFFSGMLERGRLVSFLAPEKTGKSWWLMDLAYRAMLQRKKVALFECGDLSKRQMLQRLYCRSSKQPLYSPDGNWPYSVRFPTKISHLGEVVDVEYDSKVFDKPLHVKAATESCVWVREHGVRSRKSYFKFSPHPNSTINVFGIKSVLETWKLDDWVPDVIIVDYADILAPPPGKMDVRDGINTNWKQLKGLTHELDCLVVTATQADAESYDRKTMDRRNFSEDKRKLSHVDGLIGINVTTEEKEKGLYRLNWVVKRDGEYSSRKVVHVANCLALAQPAVLSTW